MNPWTGSDLFLRRLVSVKVPLFAEKSLCALGERRHLKIQCLFPPETSTLSFTSNPVDGTTYPVPKSERNFTLFAHLHFKCRRLRRVTLSGYRVPTEVHGTSGECPSSMSWVTGPGGNGSWYTGRSRRDRGRAGYPHITHPS